MVVRELRLGPACRVHVKHSRGAVPGYKRTPRCARRSVSGEQQKQASATLEKREAAQAMFSQRLF
jgi:hypothetical protein